MIIDANFAAVFGELTTERQNRVLGQIVSIRENGKGGAGFIVTKNAEHKRYVFLGRDCSDGILPEAGALVSFEPSQRTGKYPRAKNIEILATVQKTDKAKGNF